MRSSFALRWSSAYRLFGVSHTSVPAIPPEHRAILLIEDQEDDAVLIKRALQKAGVTYPVHTVGGGIEAIAYLRGDPPFHVRIRYPLPALVLLDVRMPSMDGYEVLSWIRRNVDFAGLPVVMLTGSNEIEDANRAYQLGATSFFVKPMDFANYADLSCAVQRLIATRPT
jgi:CheY-like chemotaxis protein